MKARRTPDQGRHDQYYRYARQEAQVRGQTFAFFVRPALGKWQEGRRYLGRLIREYPGTRASELAAKRVEHDFFAIQAGVFSQPASAETRLTSLRKASLPAWTQARRGKGRMLEVVYVGRYNRDIFCRNRKLRHLLLS